LAERSLGLEIPNVSGHVGTIDTNKAKIISLEMLAGSPRFARGDCGEEWMPAPRAGEIRRFGFGLPDRYGERVDPAAWGWKPRASRCSGRLARGFATVLLSDGRNHI